MAFELYNFLEVVRNLNGGTDRNVITRDRRSPDGAGRPT